MHAAPRPGAMLGSTLFTRFRLHCMNSAEPLPLQSIDGAPKERIRFGIILLPNFTLTAFSGFVDLLRLSADEGDFSKPVRCSWTVIGETLAPVRASCGIQITPWDTFDSAEAFDYVVVVGGLLHSGPASIDVAAAILLRHFETATVQKALRILLVDDMQKGNAPQPHPPGLAPATHPKVKRAILLMEQHVGRSLSLEELARKLDLSPRQLERLFKAETGKAPQAYAKQVRLRTAAWLLTSSDKTVADIASSCGFSDASHLGREFRKQFGLPPMMYREQRGTPAEAEYGADYDETFPGRAQAI